MKTLHPNDLGKKYLVEDCKKIRINAVIRKARKDIFMTLIQGQVQIDGYDIDITSSKLNHGGDRLWFVCPICLQPCGIIYRHPIKNNLIGCRNCLNLEYKSRMKKGMVETKKHP